MIGACSREALRTVLEEALRQVISFDAFFVLAYDAGTHVFQGFGGYDAGLSSPPIVVPAAGTPGERVVRERRSLLTLRSDDPAAQGAVSTGTGRRSESVVRSPILSGEEVLGILSVQSYTPGLYTTDDVEVVEVIASLTAVALSNLRLAEERQAAEEALALRERQLREAQRIARLGSWTWTVASNRVTWSDELYRIYGLEPRAFGASFEAYLACVHPDDRARVRAQIEETLQTGHPFEFEERIVRPDGSERVLRSSGEVTRDAEGRTLCLVGVCLDITDLKVAQEALRASEASYRTIFELASDAIFVHDVETGAILDANRKACELHGCTLDELKALGIGGISDGRPPFDAAHAQDHVRRAAEGNLHRFEWLVRRKTGERFWVEVSLHRVRILGEDRILASVRTIDERKQAEAALQRAHDELERRVAERTAELAERTEELAQAEQRFRAIVEASPTPLLLSRLGDGSILYANDRLEALIGAEPGSLMGKATPDFYFDVSDRPRVIDTVRRQGYVRDLELRIRRAEGTPRWVSLSVQRLVFSGEPALATAFLDITERKQTEEALRASEESYRGLFDNLTELVYIQDLDGRFLSVNEAVVGAYGYSREELIGQTPALLADPARVNVEDTTDRFRRAVAGEPQRFDWWGRRKDGSTFPKEVVIQRSTYFGQDVVIAVARDITERKRNEAALRLQKTLLEAQGEASIDGILVVSETGAILSYNQRFVDMWGLPADVVASRSDEAAIRTVLGRLQDPEAFLARVAHLYDNPKETARDEIALRDGRVFDRYSAPVISSEGDYYGRIWFFRDMTAQKRHAEELEQARNEAERSREQARQYARSLEDSLEELRAAKDRLVQQEKLASLGRLTAGIAHEIKNPLNFVNNFAVLSGELFEELRLAIADGATDVEDLLDDLEQNVSMIEKHGLRADAIVKSMMQHARGGKGQHQPVDLNALVEEYLHLAFHGKQAQMPDLSLEIERDLGDDVGVVEAVPPDLGRVLLNLVDNAFDAVYERHRRDADSYEPVIKVTTRRTGTGAEVRIEDNGTGIPAAVRDRIFEPFFTTKPPGHGTGLGLSLSYDIVTQGHGGTLTVDSTEGAGTTFVVSLPR